MSTRHDIEHHASMLRNGESDGHRLPEPQAEYLKLPNPKDNDNHSVSPALRTSEESDPGTEADDEKGRLKRAPNQRSRLHTTTWMKSEPAVHLSGLDKYRGLDNAIGSSPSISKLRQDFVRTITEILLLASLLLPSRRHLLFQGIDTLNQPLLVSVAVSGSALLTPLRRTLTYGRVKGFDPGRFLYPVFLPLLIAVSANRDEKTILVNFMLGLSSLPILTSSWLHPGGDIRWLATVILLNRYRYSPELQLVYPLQTTVSQVIVTTVCNSLDPAEVQLLASGLINFFVFSTSPQACILQIMLWMGSMCIFVFCEPAINSRVLLTKIPAWRLQSNGMRHGLLKSKAGQMVPNIMSLSSRAKSTTEPSNEEPGEETVKTAPGEIDEVRCTSNTLDTSDTSTRPTRQMQAPRTSGRRSKTNFRYSFLSNLTRAQARYLNTALIGYIYLALILIILVPVRSYIARYAFSGHDPFGWAIGYLLGDIQSLRIFVTTNNLRHWILLPQHKTQIQTSQTLGQLDYYRQHTLGSATTRLYLSLYCILIITLGISLVIHLRGKSTTDTRRKVFHGVMVFMLLPAIPIDPCFFSLALTVMLGIFLLLDILRASRLPPIAKPLTSFLSPYVDGRDHRGPVTVSPVFLLLGCAIPLWLSLACIPRTGAGSNAGWEVASRDVSMVSGVVCVGMGDAAASLVGRRYGRTKWYWDDRKSIQGSIAFAGAVTLGLVVSCSWLRVGGWGVDGDAWGFVIGKAALAGIGASLMESVLTAANDNVVVPIGLWLMVKGLQL